MLTAKPSSWSVKGVRSSLMCAFCGALLFGILNKHHSLSNKTSGEPVDKDGIPLPTLRGCPQTDAQPPFLLRYSPELFAREIPEM